MAWGRGNFTVTIIATYWDGKNQDHDDDDDDYDDSNSHHPELFGTNRLNQLSY